MGDSHGQQEKLQDSSDGDANSGPLDLSRSSGEIARRTFGNVDALQAFPRLLR